MMMLSRNFRLATPLARAIHTTRIVRNEAEVADLQLNKPVENALPTPEVLQQAQDLLASSPLCFSNFDVNKMEFRSELDKYNNTVKPVLFYDGKDSDGLAHLTPWSHVFFGKTGFRGSAGTKLYKSDETIPDHKAKLEISLSEGTGIDGLNFQDYIKWVQSIENLYYEFLVANRSQFPSVAKKLTDVEDVVMKPFIASSSFRAIKTSQSVGQYCVATRRMYYPKAPKANEPLSFACEQDRRVYESYGLVRGKLNVFDKNSTLIANPDFKFKRNDIVSLKLQIRPVMSDVSHGLKHYLNSAILLHSPLSSSSAQSPLGSI